MPEKNSDNVWDEYDWERFLQEQERRTEKYMELLEKYMDHPQRDEIIAREMGWTHLLGGESREWEDEVEAGFEQEFQDAEPATQDEPTAGFGFEKHPLYQRALAFTAELDRLFADADEDVKEHPATGVLHSQATLAAAKLAAALNDDEVDELGMSIAYLKRALRALTMGLDAVAQLHDAGLVSAEQSDQLKSRIFSIRDGIVTAMGDYRAEFRRRHGRH